LLDIDVAGSAAPGAKLAVYFAPWTEQGWVDVVTTAIHDTTNNPSVISVSYGWPENDTFGSLTWSLAAIKAVNATFQEAAALGVTLVVSSGDSGSGCGVGDIKAHVLYPGSDPYVTCVGGTTISDVSGLNFTETTWNDNGVTGGGISDIFYPPNFPLPPWQNWVTIPVSANDGHIARGIPDIAGNADPYSGYDLFQGGTNIGAVGGTSAAAPLYAALVALMNASLGTHLGWLNPKLYGAPYAAVFRDIKDGGSNATGGAPGYTAGPGWDACTGLGSVKGASLMRAVTLSISLDASDYELPARAPGGHFRIPKGATLMSVGGHGFTANALVHVAVFVSNQGHPVAGGSSQLRVDGTFSWSGSVFPQLPLGSQLTAVAVDTAGLSATCTSEVTSYP
jgi:kumamolisin